MERWKSCSSQEISFVVSWHQFYYRKFMWNQQFFIHYYKVGEILYQYSHLLNAGLNFTTTISISIAWVRCADITIYLSLKMQEMIVCRHSVISCHGLNDWFKLSTGEGNYILWLISHSVNWLYLNWQQGDDLIIAFLVNALLGWLCGQLWKVMQKELSELLWLLWHLLWSRSSGIGSRVHISVTRSDLFLFTFF